MATMAIAKDFKCAICLDSFKEPKVLPCCHSFCKSCLQSILEKSTQKEELSCPQCRAKHPVPKDGVRGYPTDYSIPVHDAARTSICTCCQCDSSDPPTCFCSDCAGPLCQFCLQAHRRIKMYQEHVIVPLSSGVKVTSNFFTKHEIKISCVSHPQELLNIYCKSCHTLVCCECLVSHHQSHKLATVKDETRQEVQEEISQLLELSSEKHHEMVEAKEYISSVETFVLERTDELKKTINATYKKVFDSLRKKQREQLSKAEAICGRNLKTIWSEKDCVDRTCTSLQSAIDFAERNFKCGNIELLRMSTQVMSRLKELNTFEWDESQLERIEFTSSYFKSTSHSLHIGEVESLSCARTSIRLQVETIPTELPLAKTFVVSVQQCVKSGLPHPVGFQLPSIGAVVTYGATEKILSDVYISVTKKKWGHWEVSFTPVCGGVHKLRIFVTDQEQIAYNWIFKVIGRPWTNACVSKGPDFGKPMPTTEKSSSSDEQSEEVVQTVAPYYSSESVTGNGRVRNSYYPFGRYPRMILVEWDLGGSCIAHCWGNNNYYDIELVI